ncbi:Anti-ECFsigma factor, ChrR [Candidatus Sulfopaludibacter sp. SbA3]|nr:Anti-ECFsigma factor, ChrR [Candidatus Sulfopaludibacter sp. SbA3]
MRHPNQATLALHAGGDLGKLARWKLERHLAKCDACAGEVAAFEDVREAVADLSEVPDLPWNQLAAEMKANIRLGLAAGDCVRTGETPLRDTRWFSGVRLAVACTGVAALIVTGVVLRRPQPPIVFAQTPTVESTANGIQLSSGGTAMGLMNRGVQNVSYVPNAEGAMSASYADSTGGITVNTVYGQ